MGHAEVAKKHVVDSLPVMDMTEIIIDFVIYHIFFVPDYHSYLQNKENSKANSANSFVRSSLLFSLAKKKIFAVSKELGKHGKPRSIFVLYSPVNLLVNLVIPSRSPHRVVF